MILIDFSPGRRQSRPMSAMVFGAMFFGAVFVAAWPAHGSAFAQNPPLPPASLQSASPLADFHAAIMAPAPEQFSQLSVGRSQPDRRTREIADHEHAKDRRDRGKNKSFDELFQRASSVGRGEYLGVEPDISSNIYRFKFMRTSGKVVWVDMDGRTGRVLAERE